ncbi:MAG: polysaccharide biosynthesis tyrosine autokinase [Ruminococcus sp.]|nr:polysaccharide biosynthesis tyrosine autokinase [Ruminococcus sp.]
MNKSYSIKDLFNIFMNNLKYLVIAAVIGGVCAFAYSKYRLPLLYSSHITMYVQSYYGYYGTDYSYGQNDITGSKQLVNTYVEVIKDDAVMEALGEKLYEQFDENTLRGSFVVYDGKISCDSLRSCISISTVTDTSALKVVTMARNPEIAAAICNELTALVPEFVAEAVGIGSINTIDTAKVYPSPVSPNNKRNAVMGAFAGFMLVFITVFMKDFLDNTVKSSQETSILLKSPVLGEVDFFINRTKENKYIDVYPKLSDPNIPFLVLESYKSIRTNILFSLSTCEKKIFAVSSPDIGEGKSLTSANIATALAQGDKKVLLIDADMRKPVQHRIFRLNNENGLSSVLRGMISPDECINKNVVPNLDVMTSGAVPPNPSELLASENMSEIVEQLRHNYDIIIFDTPSVNFVSDVMELAKCISGIVMVLRYAKTNTESAETAQKKLEFAKISSIGFVLNGVKRKRERKYALSVKKRRA